MADITFADVTKAWPDGGVALDHIDLAIRDGELFGIVGPSGCGKTTALRILAGLEQPTSGRVGIGGRDLTNVPTRHRNIGLVTDSNLLLSHRTTRGNIQFPLEVGDRPVGPNPKQRVDAEAEALGVHHLLDRAPATLSEGEKRLVQLARAIITSPSTLLLDEPLMHLDDQISTRVRSGILHVHRTRRLTTLLVTADQLDAMTMSDRLAVLFDGTVHQIGTPDDIYHRPATARVARFFGEPAMNVVLAPVRAEAGHRAVDVLGRAVTVWTPLLDDYTGRSVLVGIRPEDLVLGDGHAQSLEATVRSTEPMGPATMAELETTGGATINCKFPGAPPPHGTMLDIGLRAERFHIFDPATELAILHPSGPA